MERSRIIFGHLGHSGRGNSEGIIPNSRVNPDDVAREIRPQQTATAPRHFVDSDDDVVIVHALRTPLCKARRGGFKDTLPDDMLAAVFSAVMQQSGVRPDMIQDITVGNVNQPGAGAATARIAQFFSGIPETVPLKAVNRMCSSGLQATAEVAAAIKAGYIDIGIGAGFESMTVNQMGKVQEGFVLNPKVMDNPKARDTLIPMGITSENVADRFGVTRQMQDQMAMESHAKAARAQKEGRFSREIVPVTTILKDKDGNEQTVTLTKDDGVRAGTTMETLAKLKPAFKPGGTTTAGNSSQLTDGAAAVILARRSYARQHNLPVFGVFRHFSVVGVPPDIMGVGPAYAIPEVLKKTGMTVDDIDVFEVNEAFASQAYYSVQKAGIPMEKVNPNGGAIALGHPLGCTGARQIATLLHELQRRGKPAYGVVSMCIGTGMGAAAVIEYTGKK